MNGLLTMIKMNFRLLIRNKGYLVFLIILPVLSVLMLNMKNASGMDGNVDTLTVREMTGSSEVIMNMMNSKLSVKVYDCSNSALADYILDELAKTGSYKIYRYRSEAMNMDKAKQEATNAANHNVIGAVIYIPADFESGILSGKESNMVVFAAKDDIRITLLEGNVNSYLTSISRYAAAVQYDKTALNTLLGTSVKNEMNKKTVGIEVGDTVQLTTVQKNQSAGIGYSLAFLIISFLFSGIFIGATVINEKQNRVYNRIALSDTSILNYGLSKLAIIIVTVVIQTCILSVAIKLFVKTDYGISFGSYVFLVFGLGLIFNTLSVVIGIITNDVLTSNYIAFFCWCISDILAGLYFSLDAASGLWSKASLMMPQRWTIKAAEMIMSGKSGVYGMYTMVVISYLIVIASVGFMGIMIRRKE